MKVRIHYVIETPTSQADSIGCGSHPLFFSSREEAFAYLKEEADICADILVQSYTDGDATVWGLYSTLEYGTAIIETNNEESN